MVDRTLARKPAWYAQWLWGRLGPVRLGSPQDVANGVWTAAGAGADADGTRVDVLVASFLATGAHDHALHLSVAGVHPGRWRVRLFRVDAAHPGSTDPAEEIDVTAGPDRRVQLDTALPAQSVVLAELVRPPASVAALRAESVAPQPSLHTRDVLPATGPRPSVWWPLAALTAFVLLQARRRRSSRPVATAAAAATGSRGDPPVPGSRR